MNLRSSRARLEALPVPLLLRQQVGGLPGQALVELGAVKTQCNPLLPPRNPLKGWLGPETMSCPAGMSPLWCFVLVRGVCSSFLSHRLVRRCLRWEGAEQFMFRCLMVLLSGTGVTECGAGAPAGHWLPVAGEHALRRGRSCAWAGAQAATMARPTAVCGSEKRLIPVQSLEALPSAFWCSAEPPGNTQVVDDLLGPGVQ